MTPDEEIGLRIWRYLGDNGITQAHVARKLGMVTSNFNAHLLTGRSFRVCDYAEMCKILCVPCTYFIAGDPQSGPLGLSGEDIRDRIKRYLRRKHITRAELAEYVGMSVQGLNNLLLGKSSFRFRHYIDICDALELRYTYFFEWEEGYDYDRHFPARKKGYPHGEIDLDCPV